MRRLHFSLFYLFFFSLSITLNAQSHPLPDRPDIDPGEAWREIMNNVQNGNPTNISVDFPNGLPNSLLNSNNSNHSSVSSPSAAYDASVEEHVVTPGPSSMDMISQIKANSDLYTGKLNAGIPIYTLTSKEISVPITMGYNSSGIKVNDIGTWTGIGWNLSAGGSITRVIKNLPDEYDYTVHPSSSPSAPSFDGFGYLNIKDVQFDGDPNCEGEDGVIIADWENYCQKKKQKIVRYSNWHAVDGYCYEFSGECPKALDTQPDEFFFNFGGYSGKFVFDQYGEIHTIPHQNLIIDETIENFDGGPKISKFVVTTPEGMKYYFGGNNLSKTEETRLQTTSMSVHSTYQHINNQIIDGINVHLYSVYAEPDVFKLPNGAGAFATWGFPGNTVVNSVGFYTSTWHLDKIEAPNRDKMVFDYEDTGELHYIQDKNYNVNVPNLTSAIAISPSTGMPLPNEPCGTSLRLFVSLTEPKFDSFNGGVINTFKRYPNGPVTTYTVNEIYSKGKRLKSIETEVGLKLEFEALTPRYDLATQTDFDKLLDRIILFNGETEIKSWVFNYDKKTSPIFEQLDEVINFTPYNKVIYKETFDPESSSIIFHANAHFAVAKFDVLTSDGLDIDAENYGDQYSKIFAGEHERYFLNKIKEIGEDDSEIELLNFEYDETILPKRFHFNQDDAGYYNFNMDTRTLLERIKFNNSINGAQEIAACELPLLPFDNVNLYEVNDVEMGNWSFFGHKKTADFNLSKACILKKINFNTGGSKLFNYELNKIFNSDGVTTDYLGLRVKNILTHPGDSPDILETFSYSHPSLVFGARQKMRTFTEANNFDRMLTVSSNPLIPHYTTSGGEVGYGQVTVSQPGNGKTVYDFITPSEVPNQIGKIVAVFDDPTGDQPFEDNNGNNIYTYPFPPLIDFDWRRGLTKKVEHFNEDDALVKRVTNKWDFKTKNFLHTNINGLVSGLFRWYTQYDAIDEYRAGFYHHTSDWYNLERTTETTYDPDGGNPITKVTDYKYRNNPTTTHLNPIEVSFTNSDGKLHKTKTYYPDDKNWNSSTTGTEENAAIGLMLDRHMVNYPLRTEHYVDGSLVSGGWTEYGTFPSLESGYDLVLPSFSHNYEGSWYQRVDFKEYTPDGFIHKLQKRGWEEEIYEWNNALLTDKYFIDWHWNWEWYDDTHRQLKSHTGIEGNNLTTSYFYDGFERLSEVHERESNVKTKYQYGYIGNGDPENFVRTEVEYDDFSTQINVGVADGLGRDIKTRSEGYGPEHETYNTNEIYYDAYGRVERQTYQYDLVNLYTNFEYEESPLNRVLKETYPDGYFKESKYEAEGNYPKATIIDENGNPSSVVSDLLGRQIKLINAKGHETLYEYDDRNNLEKITNAEGQEYLYDYDAHNRMTRKKIPGTDTQFGCQVFSYNERDLVNLSQDGNMRAEDKWIVTDYDLYGRVKRTGFYTSGNTVGNICSGIWGIGVGFDPVIEDLLVENTYDVQECEGNPTGKLTITTAEVLNQGYSTDQTVKNFCYDKYGRNNSSNSSSLSGYDEYTYAYDFADHVKNITRSHSSAVSINVDQQNFYDHSGRLKFVYHRTNNNTPIELIHNTYNPRDQIIEKNLHGVGQTTPASTYLQSLDFLYNSRGWLTNINTMPFEATSAIPVCEDDPNPPNDDPTGGCGDCGDAKLSLKDIIKIRELAGNDLKIDCYIPCDCEERCSNSNSDPCADGEETGPVINVGSTNMAELQNPKNIYLIQLCDGSTEYVFDELLPTGGYSIIQIIPVGDLEKELEVLIAGESQTITITDFIKNLQHGYQIDVTDGHSKECEPCITEAPECSEEAVAQQSASLQDIEANLITSDDNIDYPTTLYRLRLCGGTEIYLLAEELDRLEGNYYTIAEIAIENGFTEIPLFNEEGDFTANITFSGFLRTRRLSDDSYLGYLPCEFNKITREKIVNASDVFYSGFFADYFTNQNGYNISTTDLVSLNPGGENSFTENDVFWNITKTRIPGKSTIFGEAEWDVDASIPSDVELVDYAIEIGFEYEPELQCTFGIKFALVDIHGNFIEVNGGQQIVHYALNGSAGAYDISLKPDGNITTQQARNMRVLTYTDCSVDIDYVRARLKYTEPRDRCNQDALTCTNDESQAQQDSLKLINAAAQNMDIRDLSYPTALYRVEICSGQEIYLLQHELDRLPEPYRILQEVEMLSFDQNFTGGGLPPHGSGPVDANDLFALQLDYYSGDNNLIPSAPGYGNGNIASMYWQVKGRDRQAYGYKYDVIDQLKEAQYADITFEGVYSDDHKYNVPFILYDKIGNINHLIRRGPTDFCEVNGELVYDYGTIDNLSYKYNTARTRLERVRDTGTQRGFKAPESNYTYDFNGNITSDDGKGISNITYNYLNLPEIITFTNGNSIEFVYDAAGMKLKKIVNEGSNEKVFDYDEGIEHNKYESYIYFGDGRVRLTNGEVNYEYTIRDHLGNARVSFSDLNGSGYIETAENNIGNGYTEILQENHYYPFGMTMDGSWTPQIGIENQYQYNNKELHKDLGLNLYMYGARYYDPAICRFTGVDPIADNFAFATAYNYAENSPISNIDLHGLQKVEMLSGDPGLNAMNATPQQRQFYNEKAHGAIATGVLVGAGIGAAGYGLGAAWTWAISNPMAVINGARNIGYALFEATTEQYALGFGAGFMGSKLASKALSNITAAEKSIVYDASKILTSKNLQEAIETGAEADFIIGQYTIQFRPNSPFSGFTDFANNAFVIGKEAFDETGEELAKTVLHELWRLNNSLYKGGSKVTADDIINAGFENMHDVFSKETDAAAKFADDVIDNINK